MESFRDKLNEIRRTIDSDRHRRRVLLLCQQTEPKSFDEYSSSGSFKRLEKFESSTYSEVLKAINSADNNRPVVMKIMRALSKGVIKRLPSAATKGCQAYNDILNELVVSQALSQLHDGVVLGDQPTCLYRTHFFCLIHEIKVVSGSLERTLSKSQPKEQNKDEDLKNLSEDDRMLMEALPYEYVVSVMKHDGQPLWWMMSHKKLSAEQLTSVLVQVIVGIAIAERVYQYEHRDLHVSNILIKKTPQSVIPFVLEGTHYKIISHGIKATIIDATFSRLTHNGKVYFRDLTSTLRAYGSKKTPPKMSLQNRSYRQMVSITNNHWDEFTPKTNLIWLTYLCETLMKNEVIKLAPKLLCEIKKIRDYTLKVDNTLDLLSNFPLEVDKDAPRRHKQASKAAKIVDQSGRSPKSHQPNSQRVSAAESSKDGASTATVSTSNTNSNHSASASQVNSSAASQVSTFSEVSQLSRLPSTKGTTASTSNHSSADHHQESKSEQAGKQLNHKRRSSDKK